MMKRLDRDKEVITKIFVLNTPQYKLLKLKKLHKKISTHVFCMNGQPKPLKTLVAHEKYLNSWLTLMASKIITDHFEDGGIPSGKIEQDADAHERCFIYEALDKMSAVERQKIFSDWFTTCHAVD